MKHDMKRFFLGAVLALLAVTAALASSDDGYMVRAGDAMIEVRISIGDPHYAELFSGIARPDNLFFSLMRWAKAYASELGTGPRALMLFLRSDQAGAVSFSVTEKERTETYGYPYHGSRYDEDFFIGVLNAWCGFKEAKKLPGNVSLIVLHPAGADHFPTVIYPYTDVYRGPIPGAEMTGADRRPFFACFYYKNIDRYLSDHLKGEFIISKTVVNASTVRKLFP
jgi:hypothetical protein